MEEPMQSAETTAIEVKGRTYGVTLNRNVAGQ